MTPVQPGGDDGLRAIAFASPDGTAWGAALTDGGRWSLRLGPGGAPVAGEVRVTDEPDGGWRLEREQDAVALVVVPEPAPVPDAAGETDAAEADAADGADGADGDDPQAQAPPGAAFVPGEGPELCRVTGTVSGRAVDWRAVRATVAAPRSAKDAPGSARLVAGWFADGSAVGLIAARPRRSDEPDADVVSATLFDPERWLAVSDPRLSTTYDGSGAPARVNLELWIGEGDHEYPRRAAGEAVAASAADGPEVEGGALRVLPLRCHSRGEEGVGLYVLASF